MSILGWPHEAEEFFAGILTPKSHVFEWGPGHSTVVFARHAGFVVSVEHDAGFWKIAKNRMVEFTNYWIHFAPPFGTRIGDPADPGDFCSGDNTDDFKPYVRVSEMYPPASFKLVYVDGRARPACMRAAQRLVAPGGYVALHDAQREHYFRARVLYSGWHPTRFETGGIELAVWQRSPKT